ncbi:MAG TPA: peptidoglycan DD-metalloendopeptidase family protein [Sphingobacteriaceae bacterium]|nr:peptidoglycan DD-metalloendopeptidase family protein [Sphingobacteriaceae bacterium]
MSVIRSLLVFMVALVVMVPGLKAQQSSAELQKQRERLDREIRQLSESLKTTSSDRTLSLRQVNALTAQLRLREQKIATINQEIRILNNQIATNTRAVKQLEEELAQLRQDYERMVLFAFRNRNAHHKMMFIFASKDFNQAFKRVKYLQQLNESRKNKSVEIAETQAEIELKLAQLEASRKEQAALLAEQQSERKEIAAEQGEESRVLRSLTAKEKEFEQEINMRQQELRRLTAAINQAIQRELEEERRREEEARKAAVRAEAARTGKTVEEIEAETPTVTRSNAELLAATPEAARLSADFASNKGRLPWPVKNGIVTTGFGMRTDGVNAQSAMEGIRIQTHEGMAVTAVFDGEVTVVLQLQGLGYVVLVKHGQFYTVYGNLRGLTVKKGDSVTTGQTLGTAITDSEGMTEVHFELIDAVVRQNPEHWLAK